MPRVGKYIDNGIMGGIFGVQKTEMFYGKKVQSIDNLIAKIRAYIFFNKKKSFQKRLNSLAPIEYRNQAPNIA